MPGLARLPEVRFVAARPPGLTGPVRKLFPAGVQPPMRPVDIRKFLANLEPGERKLLGQWVRSLPSRSRGPGSGLRFNPNVRLDPSVIEDFRGKGFDPGPADANFILHLLYPNDPFPRSREIPMGFPDPPVGHPRGPYPKRPARMH